MTHRDSSIDIAKALSISSVVLGHILEARVLAGGGIVDTVIYNWIYAFHMPFWFLLSGYLYRGTQEPLSFFCKKFEHLLLPYFVWLIVYNSKALAGLTLNLIRGMSDEKWLFYQDHFYNQAYGGELVSGAQIVIWFPVCLFFTQQIANLLFLCGISCHARWSVGLLFYILGYVNQFFVPNFTLPLALNVVAGAIPFFLIGHGLRGVRSRRISLLVISFTLFVIFGIAILHWPLHFHMRMAEYGWPIVSTLGAVGAFLVSLKFCRSLADSNWLVRISTPVGEASMTIMYLHVLVLSILVSIGMNSWPVLLIGGVFISTILHFVLKFVAPSRWCFCLSRVVVSKNR